MYLLVPRISPLENSARAPLGRWARSSAIVLPSRSACLSHCAGEGEWRPVQAQWRSCDVWAEVALVVQILVCAAARPCCRRRPGIKRLGRVSPIRVGRVEGTDVYVVGRHPLFDNLGRVVVYCFPRLRSNLTLSSDFTGASCAMCEDGNASPQLAVNEDYANRYCS